MLLDISGKFRKPIFGRKYIYQWPKILRYINQGAGTPPNNPGYMAIDGGAAPWFGGSYLGL